MSELIPTEAPSKSRWPWILALVLMLGIGLGLGLVLGRHEHAPTQAVATSAPKSMYQCPMHPQIIQDHPGNCPICGMALVPMDGTSKPQPGESHGEHAAISIDPTRQQLIGLRLEPVTEETFSGEIRATGRVAVDETRVRKISVKVEGFVEKLFVDFVGKPVAKGSPLFSLYSPEFVSAQREHLLALKTQRALGGNLQGSGTDLLESSRRRLQLWDVPPEAIERLEKTGEVQRTLVLRSPISGVVTAKNVVEGARIGPADAPLELTDLSRVWVLADVFETELGRIHPGGSAQLSLTAFPGRTFEGRVAFIDPALDPKTRTAKVRLEFANHGDLKPEMFGEVRLHSASRKGLMVGVDSVLDSGTTKVVFVALGQGRFEPRTVEVGTQVGERVEIRSGLKAGESVVTRAAFLVDSESRLKAALAQMGKKP